MIETALGAGPDLEANPKLTYPETGIARQIMDARGMTQICSSPVVVGESPSRSNSAMLMYLIVVRGGIPGSMLRLETTTRLGRSVDNTYQLDGNTVSRHHASISVDPSGTAYLVDLGSSNGTFVNGKRIPSHQPVRLADGSRIQLGSSLLLKYLRLDPCDEGFQREMFERSVRDNLTGLFNRAYFSNQIVPLAERNEQLQLGLAIILIDLDHFKRINDTYGHNGGDLVLREVAAVLRDSTRAEDLVARYGGEEFVIALPSTTLEQAIERAERIRTQIAERGIDEGSIGDIRVTASLGLSFSPAGHARNIPGLISAADSALYDAKKLGRNRVSCARAGIRGTAAKTESADSLVIL